MPITEEWAKNPKAEIEVQCRSCGGRYSIQEGLKEEPISVPDYAGVTEMFWRCPHCLDHKHSCYMTPELRTLQRRLKKILTKYNETHASEDFFPYLKEQKEYQGAFDREQEDIRRALEESRDRTRA